MSASPRASRVTIARVTMRQRTASRRVRVRSGKAHRNKARPPAVLLHDVKQPASRPSPRSTSRSRGAFFAPGSSRRVSLSPPHSPLHVPALLRARAQILGVSCSSGPENERAGGTPGGVTAVVALVSARHSRLRACPSRATGTSASRRSTVALPGPRCVSGISAGAGARLARRPSFLAGYGPRVRPRLRAAADATPRSAVRIVSGDAPHERG